MQRGGDGVVRGGGEDAQGGGHDAQGPESDLHIDLPPMLGQQNKKYLLVFTSHHITSRHHCNLNQTNFCTARTHRDSIMDNDDILPVRVSQVLQQDNQHRNT